MFVLKEEKKGSISSKVLIIGSETAKENNLSLGSTLSSKERCGRESHLQTFLVLEQLPLQDVEVLGSQGAYEHCCGKREVQLFFLLKLLPDSNLSFL